MKNLVRWIPILPLFVVINYNACSQLRTVASATDVTSGQQCMSLDLSARVPYRLEGKIVGTYYEQSIDWEDGDIHELGAFNLSRPQAGTSRLSTNLTNEAEIDVSPDGKKILYTVRPRLDDFENTSEIWVSDINGTNAVRLRSGDMSAGAVWYPDSKNIAVNKVGDTSGTIYRMDTLTKRESPLSVRLNGRILNPGDLEISYDGKLITFKAALDNEPGPSIYVMNADGSNIRRLTGLNPDVMVSDHDPVFSRDGKKIYFERFDGQSHGRDTDWFDCSQERTMEKPHCQWWSIVEVDVQTAREKIVVPHDPCGRHFFWLPTVSPDGQYLMFTHHDMLAEAEERPTSGLLVVKISESNPRPYKVPGSDWFYFFDWTR